MEVIPAIDIRNGKCVRLYQGDYDQETIYSSSPEDVALRWEKMGASRIHIADLDGAKEGNPINTNIIKNIVSSTTSDIQLGGGIRTLEIALEAVALGVSRIVIGTSAVENPTMVKNVCESVGSDTVIVSVDAKEGDVLVQGWTRKSNIRSLEMVKKLENVGIQRIIYTDVSRDGTLGEPNFSAIENIVGQTNMNVIVAGGISSIEHVWQISQIGVEGAIIGKAIYIGAIDLREAIGTIGKQQ